MSVSELVIEHNKNPEDWELMALFRQTAWAKNRTIDQVTVMLAKTDMSVCLRRSGKLLAYGRIINDGCFRGLLDDVIVDESVRGIGLGTLLMKNLLELAKPLDVLFLHARPEMLGYYEKFGFTEFDGSTMVRR